jgi:hypothetical protein
MLMWRPSFGVGARAGSARASMWILAAPLDPVITGPTNAITEYETLWPGAVLFI